MGNGPSLLICQYKLQSTLNSMENVSSAEVEVHSSVTSFENSEFHVKYDIQSEKKVEVKLTYGSKSVELIGKQEGETFVLDVSTPFADWEHMKLSVFLSETAIDAF